MISEAYLMDCMEYMATVPDKWFDLAVVDPPYGLGVDGINPIKNKGGDKNHKYDHSKQWDLEIPDKLYFDELIRVSKNQIIWGGNYFFDYLGYCKAPLIWDKLNGGSMFADGELAWTSNGLPKNLKIWRHQWCGAFKDSERGTEKYHPTQKPIALYQWIYANYLPQGGKVIDTHLGSGSNRIAADKAGNIDFYATEIDKDYFEAQEKRWREYKAQAVLTFPERINPVQTDLF